MTTPLLSLSSVACTRGGVTILDNVSFQLLAGEAIILRGPNGSGKTTLLRTISGLQPCLHGVIDAAPDSIAYAAHADGLKSTLSVAENLEFWAALFGTRSIEPALEAFDLHSLKHRRAQALSAGQKRRLGLARLLVSGRPVWALDEPTVSLDKIDHRLEVLEGFITAFLNLDRVIDIIRYDDDPKAALIREDWSRSFVRAMDESDYVSPPEGEGELTEVQVEAILNMRLRALRRLEEMELRREFDELLIERAEFSSRAICLRRC